MDPLSPILKACWALPLLPPAKFLEGIKILDLFVSTNPDFNAGLSSFVSCLKSWCINLKEEIIFIDDNEYEAINTAEDFLRSILNLLGEKPSLYNYLGNSVLILIMKKKKK